MRFDFRYNKWWMYLCWICFLVKCELWYFCLINYVIYLKCKNIKTMLLKLLLNNWIRVLLFRKHCYKPLAHCFFPCYSLKQILFLKMQMIIKPYSKLMSCILYLNWRKSQNHYKSLWTYTLCICQESYIT